MMTGEVLAFRKPVAADEREALLAAVVELHALIGIDPGLGASPVRVYFVFNPQAKARIEASVDGSHRKGARAPTAYALVAFDFPFALHLFEMAGSRIPTERAKQIITCSAELQEGALERAADTLGIDAVSIADFDADALKATFFPNTQESVTHVFQLELQQP
jgi:hypothetical protein